MGVQQIQTFGTAHIVGGVCTAVKALVTQFQQCVMHPVRGFGLQQKVHVLGGAHYLCATTAKPPIKAGSVRLRANMDNASRIWSARLGMGSVWEVDEVIIASRLIGYGL